MTADKNAFVQKILSVKSQLNDKGLKLKHLFSSDLDELSEVDPRIILLQQIRESLAESPEIIDYLSRPASEVDFIEDHPHLIDTPKGASRDEKEGSDHYELMFNKGLNFGYRKQSDASAFYKSFSPNGCGRDFLTPILRNSATDSCHVLPYDLDIYRVRTVLDGYFVDTIEAKSGLKFECPLSRAPFPNKSAIAFLNVKDGFPTTVLALMDVENRLPLATIFMGCNKDSEYTDYLKYRFNMKNHDSYQLSSKPDFKKISVKEFYSLSEEERDKITDKVVAENSEILKQYLTQEYGFTFVPGKVIGSVNEEKSMGLYYNEKHSYMEDPEYKVAAKMDLMFDFNGDNCYFSNKKVIPFIDASHELRNREVDEVNGKKGSVDNNNFLYNINFIRAITDFLDVSGNLDHVLELARNGKHTKLQDIFQADLKVHLPMYYDADGNKRPDEEIKHFHLQQRWDLDSESLRTNPKRAFRLN